MAAKLEESSLRPPSTSFLLAAKLESDMYCKHQKATPSVIAQAIMGEAAVNQKTTTSSVIARVMASSYGESPFRCFI